MNSADESSDILGGKILQSPPPPSFWSSLPFSVRTFIALACGLGIYIVSTHAWREVLRWREKSYKLAVRRKHGIPDNDHRPFNVAYAAVMRARREQEKASSRPAMPATRGATQGSSSAAQAQAVSLHANTPDQQQSLPFGIPSYAQSQQLNPSSSSTARQRQVPLRHMDSSWSATPGLPGRYLSEGISSALPSGRPRTVSSNSATLSNPRGASIGLGNDDADRTSKRLDINGQTGTAFPNGQPSRVRGSKRGLDDDVEGIQDGDYYYYDDSDEASGPSKRKRDKRARKVSLEKGPNGQPVLVEDDDNDNDMVVDEDEGEGDDVVADLRSIVRGKKRDRAEAGSTFGGDDDESMPEEDEIVSTTERRRRKRRTVSKRKSDAALSIRGQKRDRGDTDDEDIDDFDEDGDDTPLKTKRKHTKKRGKRGSHVHEQLGIVHYGGYDGGSGSDVSMDGSGVSSHPSCKGRKVGEEWESHGVQYKVGINGERLRRVLIKQERSKFPMPADSEHPDRDAGVEIFVEKWLTDAEYKVTKSQQLAVSITPSSSTEPETPRPEDEEDSQKTLEGPAPPPVGKNLLYEAPGTPSQRRYAAQYRGYDNTTVSQDPFRQSVATNVGLRPNSRRIAVANARIATPNQRLLGTPPASPISLTGSMNGSLADSTNINGGLNNSTLGYRASPMRMYSKWEKQDMEAAAMRKVREAAMKKEAEKKEREAKEKARTTAAAPPPVVTLTPAAPTPVPSSAAPTPSPSPFPSSKPECDKEKAAAPAPAATKPPPSIGFGFPPPATSSSSSTSAPAPTPAPAPPSTFGSAPPLGSTAPEVDKANVGPAPPANPFAAASSNNGSGSGVFAFGKPSAPVSTSTTPSAPAPAPPSAPPASGNSMPNFFSKPAATSTTPAVPSKPADSPLKFSFGPTSGSNSTPSTTTTTTNVTTNASQFGTFPSSTTPSSNNNPSQASGGPLFGRVGGQAANPTPASQPSAPPLKFSFGAPAATPAFGTPSPAAPSQPAPIFGGGSTTANVTGPSAPSTTTTTTPKFSFGVGATSAPTSAAASGGANKPAAPTPAAFGFPTPKDATALPTGGSQFNFGGVGKTEASKPAFTLGPTNSSSSSPFGTTGISNSSPFGASANNASSSTANPPAQQTTEAPKSAFTAFGANNVNPSNPFGSTTPASAPSAFGNNNVFGSTPSSDMNKAQSAFGSSTSSSTPATVTDNKQPVFSFGAKSAFPFGQTQTSSTPTASADSTKPTAAFGASSTTPAAAPTSSGFSFGSTSNTTTPSSAFGFTSTPSNGSAFTFGNTSNGTTGAFKFGVTPSTPSKQ